MASLVGQQLKDTYDSLLKTSDNDALGGTYKEITDGSGNGSNLYLGTGGNVGIGTSSIDGTLHLDAGTSSDLVIEKDGGGGAAVRFHNDGSQVSYIQLDTSEDMIYYGGSGVNQIIYAGGVERMRIDSSGNVGINGTASDKLEVAGLSNYTGLTLKGNGASRPALTFRNVTQSLLGSIYGTENRSLTFESGGNGTAGVVAMNIDSSGIVQARRARSNTAGNVALSLQPSDSTIHYGFRIDSANNFLNIDRVDSAGTIMTLDPSVKVGIGTNPADILHIKQANGAQMRFENATTGRNIRIGEGVGTTDVFSFRGSGVGTDTLSVDFANNRVGINNIQPVRTLHIDGGSISSDTPTLRISSTDSSGTNKFGIEFFSNSGSDVRGKLLADNNGKVYLDDNGGGGVILQGNGGTGNVGIGTSSPSRTLDVEAPAGAIEINSTAGGANLFLTSTSGNLSRIRWNSAAGSFAIRDDSNSSDRFVINNSGNVGIGSSDPQTTLHLSSTSPELLLTDTNAGTNVKNYSLYTDDGKLHIRRLTDAYSGYTPTMTFDQSNVGIGVSPSATLHIDNPANPTSLRIGSNTTDDCFILFNTDGNDWAIGADRSASNSFKISDNSSLGTADRLVIDTSGNVGIGTDSPDAFTKLTVAGAMTLTGQNTGHGASRIKIGQDTSGISQIRFYGANASTAGILQFTGSSSDGTVGDERMRIDSSGNILFGGISALPNGTSVYGSAFRTDTNGRMGLRLATSATGAQTLAEFFNGNGSVGSIQTNASATSYVTSSDYRLKENVVSMTGALDRVDQLNPSRFNFIADADTTVDGFLAHEVADVVPEAITGEKDATEEYEITPAVLDDDGNVVEEAVMGTRPVYQGIDQSKLVPLLVGAIQELRAEIEQLKNQ